MPSAVLAKALAFGDSAQFGAQIRNCLVCKVQYVVVAVLDQEFQMGSQSSTQQRLRVVRKKGILLDEPPRLVESDTDEILVSAYIRTRCVSLYHEGPRAYCELVG
jgi:hypothetical protein